MNKIKSVLLGFIIGVAAITPGLSGGILAIVLGVYAPALDAVMTINHNFKKSFSYLLPLGLGVLLGLGVFGVVMRQLLENYEKTVIYCFIGLIIGSLPSLLKEATKEGIKKSYFAFSAIAIAIGLFFSFAVAQNNLGSSASSVVLLISGVFLAMGILIPGISSSFLLMQLGSYDDMINSIATLNIINLVWIGLGAAAFFFITAKLINIAFKKHHGYAYFTALGFLFASVITAFPGVPTIIDIFFFLAGMTGAYTFMKKASDE